MGVGSFIRTLISLMSVTLSRSTHLRSTHLPVGLGRPPNTWGVKISLCGLRGGDRDIQTTALTPPSPLVRAPEQVEAVCSLLALERAGQLR